MKTYTRKRPEYQIIEGAQDLCRLCLKKAEFSVPIFSDDSGNVCATLALRIMICVGLEMKNEDCLPNNVCLDCHKELERYYAFRKKCEVSYQKLKSHLLAVRIKEISKNSEKKNELTETENDSKETSNISFRVNFDGSVHLCEGNTSQIDVKPLVTLTRMDDTRQTKLLQKNEKLNHTEKTISLSNPLVFNSENIVLENKPIVFNSETIVPETNPIVFNSKTILPENKPLVFNSKTIVPENKPLVFNSETIVPENKPLVFNSETIVPVTNTLVFNSKTIVPEGNTIVSNGNTIVSEGTLIVCENNVMIQSDTELAQRNEMVQSGEVEMQNVITDADLSTFLSSLLIECNVLTQQGDELVVDPQMRTIELDTGDGRQVTWELMEEEIVEETVQESIQEDIQNSQLNLPLSVTVSNNEGNKNIVVEYINSDRLGKSDCKKTVPTDKKLKQAMQSAWCYLCRRRFASRSACSRHVRSVHSQLRPFACRLCGKTFTQKEVMIRHELVHEAVRPHKCSQCPKSFTQRGALVSHERSHAPPHARALELHRCDLCPKVFLYASGLTRHMASHTGQRFECDGCKRQFGDKSSLNRHLKNTNHAACATQANQSLKKT